MAKNNLLVEECFNELKQQISYFEDNKNSCISPGKTWSDRAQKIYQKIKNDNRILINFKKTNIFNTDVPAGNMSSIKELIFKVFSVLPKFLKYHPYVNTIEDGLKVLQEEGVEEILKKNPLSITGNPTVYRKNGYNFTLRWLRHLLILNYYEKKLSKYQDIQIVADVGTGYGTFPILMKKNFQKLKFILIDLPEQLCAARYYIKSEFPSAKIATFKEIEGNKVLDKKFFNNFDFTLIPCYLIDKLEENSTDLFANFASLNEMPKIWFDKYINSKLFVGSKYLLTMNRIARKPMDKAEMSSISILDLPLHNYQKIFFEVFQLYKWRYKTVKFLNIPIYSKKIWHDPSYIFIGKK